MKFSSRLRASAVHFAATTAAISVYLLLTYLAWYPEPYHRLENVFDVVLTLVVVTVIAGPFLTLVVFKRDKPNLKSDMGIIIALQILVFGWGVGITYSQRPVYVALVSRTLNVVVANEVDQTHLPDPSLRSSGWGGPLFVYVAIRPGSAEMGVALSQSQQSGARVAQRADKYRPLTEHLSDLWNSAIDMRSHAQEYPELGPALEGFLDQYGGLLDDYAFVTVEGRTQFQFFAFDRASGSFVAMLEPT